MNLSLAFTLALGLIIILSVFGLPMGLSMICASVLYLLMRGQDMGIVAEQFLNGIYPSACCAGATRWWGAFVAVLPRSISSNPSSLPACPARPSPTPRAPAR